MKYPEKVERRPDRIPDVRYPGEGGTSVGHNSFLGGMSYAARRKGDRLRVQGRESHVTFFREDPTIILNIKKLISVHCFVTVKIRD